MSRFCHFYSMSPSEFLDPHRLTWPQFVAMRQYMLDHAREELRHG